MRGKYLKLNVNPGEDNLCALCNAYAPLGEEKSEVLSYDLEKLLFKNGLFGYRADGFGILFNRQGGVNQWMIICQGETVVLLSLTLISYSYLDCLSYNGETQDVKDDCFRLRFHVENNNIENDNGLENIFANSPMLTQEVIHDIRPSLKFCELSKSYDS